MRTRHLVFAACLALFAVFLAVSFGLPAHSQGNGDSPYLFFIPANDSEALAAALFMAGGTNPHTPPFHLYLEGGIYDFYAPSDSIHPGLTPIRQQVVIYGNNATIALLGLDSQGVAASFEVTSSGRLELHHVRLNAGNARAIRNAGVLLIQDSSITNEAGAPDYYLPAGGGIENTGTLEVKRVTFAHNRVLNDVLPGGAIWNRGTLAVECTRFLDNRASQGGAIWNETPGTALITKSMFSGNRANGGGAVFNAANNDVEAAGNYWGGGAPALEAMNWGVDTVSTKVVYAPFASTDPTLELPECQVGAPAPIPTAFPHPLATFTATPSMSPLPATSAPEVYGSSAVIADNEPIVFSEFTAPDLDQLNLMGSAALTADNTIRLMQSTSPTTTYSGALWARSKQTIEAGFHTEFTFRITGPYPAYDGSGDGFAFVVQTQSSTVISGGGCGIGYADISGFLAIEFDLYTNDLFCSDSLDRDDNHIGLMHGQWGYRHPVEPDWELYVRPVNKTTEVNFDDGQLHRVVIDAKPTVSDFYQIDLDIDHGKVKWVAHAYLPLTGLQLSSNGTAWVGFTAGQFAARANVEILDWWFGPPLQPACTVQSTGTPHYLYPENQPLQAETGPCQAPCIELAPNATLEVYNRIAKDSNIVWVRVPGLQQWGWFNSSSGVVATPGACDNLPASRFTPQPRTTHTNALDTYGIVLVGWSEAEQRLIRTGVTNVGAALQSAYGGGTFPETFRRIMFAPNRYQIIIAKELPPATGTPGVYCLTSNDQNPPVQARISCHPNVQLSEFTVVHELGHVFTGRTGGADPAATASFYHLVEMRTPIGTRLPPNTPGIPAVEIVDHNGNVVMGPLWDEDTNRSDWLRGVRGWGSAAAASGSYPCNFQQNPLNVPDADYAPGSTIRQDEIHEAAADMFLNWVYSTIGIRGFRNIDWGGIGNCGSTPSALDQRNPGQARLDYMSSIVMPTLAVRFPTPTPTLTPTLTPTP